MKKGEKMELWDVYNINKEKTGKKIKRGEDLNNDEYHIVINAWIQNDDDKFLITKRAGNKSHPYMWECVGGSILSGEDSLAGAIREVKEEVGIDLTLNKVKFIGSKHRYYTNCNDILDVWLFKANNKIDEIIIQEQEVCDAMWASKEKIIELYNNKQFEANSFFQEVLNLPKNYYIGFNANNAICNESFFDGSITIYPNSEKGNIYYSINEIDDTKSNYFMEKYKSFVEDKVKVLYEKYDKINFFVFNHKVYELCKQIKDINIINFEKKEV